MGQKKSPTTGMKSPSSGKRCTSKYPIIKKQVYFVGGEPVNDKGTQTVYRRDHTARLLQDKILLRYNQTAYWLMKI